MFAVGARQPLALASASLLPVCPLPSSYSREISYFLPARPHPLSCRLFLSSSFLSSLFFPSLLSSFSSSPYHIHLQLHVPTQPLSKSSIQLAPANSFSFSPSFEERAPGRKKKVSHFFFPFSCSLSKVVNLDFEARVPVPFSIFPSSYKEDNKPTEVNTTQTHEEFSVQLPQHHERPGREGQYSSSYVVNESANNNYPYREEEVRVTREEERYRRPGVRREYIRENRREVTSRVNIGVFATVFGDTFSQAFQQGSGRAVIPRSSCNALAISRCLIARGIPDTDTRLTKFHVSPRTTFSETTVEYDSRRPNYDTAIDIAEREYRTRYQPTYHREEARTTFSDTTVDSGRFPQQQEQSSFVEDSTTVDAPIARPTQGSTFSRKSTKVVEDILEPQAITRKSNKMGYYDEEGNYHSFRHGVHKLADRLIHPEGRDVEVSEFRETIRSSGGSSRGRRSVDEDVPRNTVSIPCHHIRIGDILILQGRPCQVIRISTSAATGQHRYLGVDLFTKKLHEESSFVSNPSPSVVVQSMLGPVFKQYRVLDLQEGNVVAMTETGDVKQGLPVIDQSNLWARLLRAFESGRGSVRVLVVNDHGRELAVDMKVVHGASL
ncbi:Woronin body protein HexA [Sporothrix schenckii 1099-18]|uniref:Woronin body protein HexA n=1 Tax=Sporothrix schenckii 1099-18 TaxID=1397361 RepID=A0A0F2M3H4_SPOSC|nr:Woronin body protein HexA [Sporothrix schenckii 1099-18]KJR82701.1 Woronin body protein HexA [Sporothrix schenckii 1099-18]